MSKNQHNGLLLLPDALMKLRLTPTERSLLSLAYSLDDIGGLPNKAGTISSFLQCSEISIKRARRHLVQSRLLLRAEGRLWLNLAAFPKVVQTQLLQLLAETKDQRNV
jgi:hypothetical protein